MKLADGVSFDPCDNTYCGKSGGSEPETQAVQAELVRLGKDLNAVVTVHAYGNMWMFPWGNTVNFEGNTCDLADDSADMVRHIHVLYHNSYCLFVQHCSCMRTSSVS